MMWKAIFSRARAVLGPDKPIVVTLDLHANITRRMVKLAARSSAITPTRI